MKMSLYQVDEDERKIDYDSDETVVLDDSDHGESNFAEDENLQKEDNMQNKQASIGVKTIDNKGKVSYRRNAP
jgi:hypothetical protein